MTQMTALLIVLLIMGVSEIISKISHGRIPSMLIMTVIFMAGYWTILPADIVTSTGITPIYMFCSFFFMITMATKFSIAEVKQQWKTVIIALLGVAGICLGCGTIGLLICGKEMVLSTISLWAGGGGALVIIRQASEDLNMPNVLLAAMIAGSVQFLIGYPLSNVVLRKEAQRLHLKYTANELSVAGKAGGGDRFKLKPFVCLQKYSSPTVILCKLAAVSALAILIQKYTGINQMLMALIIGFIAAMTGFLETDALRKANAEGICVTFMLVFMFGTLGMATPATFFKMLPMVLVLAVLSTGGLALAAYISSKIFKDFSFYMCMGIVLNCYYGFPQNAILTEEAVNGVIDDPQERELVSSHMMPKMMVGGFTSVTFASVMLASICASLLAKI